MTQNKSVQNVFKVDTLTIRFAYFIKSITHSAGFETAILSNALRPQDQWDRRKTGLKQAKFGMLADPKHVYITRTVSNDIK